MSDDIVYFSPVSVLHQVTLVNGDGIGNPDSSLFVNTVIDTGYRLSRVCTYNGLPVLHWDLKYSYLLPDDLGIVSFVERHYADRFQ